MTSNWPYHGPVIYLFTQQIFTKSLLLVAPHPALGGRGHAVRSVGLSQAAYLSVAEADAKAHEGGSYGCTPAPCKREQGGDQDKCLEMRPGEQKGVCQGRGEGRK